MSALSIDPLSPPAAFAKYFAAGFWDSTSVELFKLENKSGRLCLERVSDELSFSALPRSVLLHNFTSKNGGASSQRWHLLVGLTDGMLVVYPISLGQDEKKGNEKLIFGERKTFSLGTAPVTVGKCVVAGKDAIIAVGGRAMVLDWNAGGVQCSQVPVKVVPCTSSVSARLTRN